MSARATAWALASALLAGLVAADAARANRLDDAGRALREPGVWVHADLTWLLGPGEARRLDRHIAAADVPLRVAVLPQVEADESRGDPRAIGRAIVRRVDRDGLYVLVDQDGRMQFVARDLPLELGSYDLTYDRDDRRMALAQRLDVLLRTVRSAPRAAPRSFEPYPALEGVRGSGGRDGDPLALVALGSALLGALGGGAVYLLLRGVVGIARLLLRGRRA